jgi:hypothetical protein
MLIDINRNPTVNTDYQVNTGKVLTDSEASAKILEVQSENLQAIESALEQNSAGWGDKIKIKVPADANGKQIQNPTAQDWENAAKNNRFVEVEDSPARLASDYFGLKLVDFGNAADNKVANGALLQEVKDAAAKGITFPSSQPIPTSEAGDVVRAFKAKRDSLLAVQIGMGNPKAGTAMPPSYGFTIKVPADSQDNPIKNPTPNDWLNAQKNNQWAEVKGTSEQLAADYFGVKLDMTNWRVAYNDNKAALEVNLKDFNRPIERSKDIEAGNRMADTALTGIDPNLIPDVMEVFQKQNSSAMNKAEENSKQMESLRKKYDAIKKMESNLEGNSAGSNNVTISVPSKRYVTDAEGNRIKNADGTYQTTNVSSPPSNDDWANAAEFTEATDKAYIVSDKYFGITYTRLDGNNKEDHATNLTQNLSKFSSERSMVDAEMKKISGKFDYWMGNVQTIMSLINKIASQVNDNNLAIIRGI